MDNERKGLPRKSLAVESMPGQDGKTEILGERSPRMNLRLVVVAIGLVFSAMLLGTGVYQALGENLKLD